MFLLPELVSTTLPSLGGCNHNLIPSGVSGLLIAQGLKKVQSYITSLLFVSDWRDNIKDRLALTTLFLTMNPQLPNIVDETGV
jgi:hypothetical protein